MKRAGAGRRQAVFAQARRAMVQHPVGRVPRASLDSEPLATRLPAVDPEAACRYRGKQSAAEAAPMLLAYSDLKGRTIEDWSDWLRSGGPRTKHGPSGPSVSGRGGGRPRTHAAIVQASRRGEAFKVRHPGVVYKATPSVLKPVHGVNWPLTVRELEIVVRGVRPGEASAGGSPPSPTPSNMPGAATLSLRSGTNLI